MDCGIIVRNGLAERYLLGELGSAEQECYEKHFFDCERCFEELRSLQAIQDALRAVSPLVPARKRELAWSPWWKWIATGAVAASLVGGVLLWQFRAPERVAGNQGTPAVATRRAPPNPAAAPSGQPAAELPEGTVTAAPATSPTELAERPGTVYRRSAVLARLARVEPPEYSPSVLRGAADEATASFQEGMRAYVAGDYRGAIAQLRKASSLDPERPDFAFYLGASELLSGDAAGAIREFLRTTAMGETPFLEEAHFYLAKAYLKQGDAGRAHAELEKVKSLQGDWRREAETILTQLEN